MPSLQWLFPYQPTILNVPRITIEANARLLLPFEPINCFRGFIPCMRTVSVSAQFVANTAWMESNSRAVPDPFTVQKSTDL
jgi:hypothetical protein